MSNCLEKLASLQIKTADLTIRRFIDDDLSDEHLQNFFADAYTMDLYVATPSQTYADETLKDLLADWNLGSDSFVYSILYHDELAGLLTLENVDCMQGVAEFGIALTNRQLRGKHLAKQACTAYLNVLENLGMQRLYARVIDGNHASLRLLQALGLMYEGTMRRQVKRGEKYLDVHLYAKLKDLCAPDSEI